MNHTILPANDFYEKTRPVIEDALKECEGMLPTQREIRVITQYTEDRFVIEKMGGSSGRTFDGTTMEVEVNTETKGWESALKSSVAHEYNHVVWHQIHKGEVVELTIGEYLVMEGLAQCFEERFFGHPPAWAVAISEEEARRVWQSVREHLSEDWKRWWFKITFEEDEFPLWSGYTLAYQMIKKQIESKEIDWPELMERNPKDLLSF